jgi:hypothetical protein
MTKLYFAFRNFVNASKKYLCKEIKCVYNKGL